MAPSAKEGRLLVGLEIHQQLAGGTKLFCACPPAKTDEFPYRFERRLRPAQSETGRIDPAAIFEFSRAKSIVYFWSPESSCLVEADEEPPHPMSGGALEAALVVARTLGSNVLDEVHVMRKIVIDGSNTSGFQRTAVVGLGGSMVVDGVTVGVQSVTVEEDAARFLGEDQAARRYALDRLGVPLVEVALDPVEGAPEFVAKVALHLGRVLRSTGRVARGLGTIRQDLNVSLDGGKVVEVKGVQKLNLLPKVIEYERKRQAGLRLVAEKLSALGLARVECTVEDVTEEASDSGSKVLRDQVSGGGRVMAIVAKGMSGIVGWEPFPGIRLGRELAEVARANSIGGVIHSDEFQKRGIPAPEAERLRKAAGAAPGDALLLLAGAGEALVSCARGIVERLKAAPQGVPAETRAATDEGETRYMRPRPGSQRMYPETDIPVIRVTGEMRRRLDREVPEGWESKVKALSEGYSLSSDLALKVYDSEMEEALASLSGELRLEPSVIASILVDIPPRLAREGVPEGVLAPGVLSEALRAVDQGKAAKEAIPEILRRMGSAGGSVDDAVAALGLRAADEDVVRRVVEEVVARSSGLLREKGEGAFSALMGEAMKELRGKADGAVVSRVLRERLARRAPD